MTFIKVLFAPYYYIAYRISIVLTETARCYVTRTVLGTPTRTFI